MKTKLLISLLKEGSASVPVFLIRRYSELGISKDEFIFLIGLLSNDEKVVYDPKELSKKLGIKKLDILKMVDELNKKKIISLLMEKNPEGINEEKIYLAPFYKKLALLFEDELTVAEPTNIYSDFEKELGRVLSPMEYEIIGGWIDDKFSEELISAALKEATYSGVLNLRYINKIIYEWRKKGIKSPKDLKNKQRKMKKEEKDEELFDYDWLKEK